MKTFSLSAATSFVLAIAADLFAKFKHADAASYIVRFGTMYQSSDDLQHGLILDYASCGLAALAVSFWIASVVRKEQGYHFVLVILLGAYLLFFFVAV